MADYDSLSPEEKRALVEAAAMRLAPIKTPAIQDIIAESAPKKPDETALARAYRSVAGPVTTAAGWAINPAVHLLSEPLVTATRMVQEGSFQPMFDERSPMASAQPLSRAIAEQIIPQTLPQAGMMAATPAARGLASGMKPLAAMAGGAVGGGLGGALELATPGGVAQGAAEGAAGAALGETLGAGWRRLRQSLPGAKAAINETQAKNVATVLEDISPGLKGVVTDAKASLSPTIKAPKTAAALREVAVSDRAQEALGARMEKSIKAVEAATGGALIEGPGLRTAYGMMPKLAQDELVGVIDPDGFTVRQAQAVRSWLGSSAFEQSPLGQGVGPVPKQKVWARVSSEIDAGLTTADPSGKALRAWKTGNQEYAGGMAIVDMLREGNAFQGQANRILMNRSSMLAHIDKNRAEIVQRIGPERYQQLLKALGGAQPGTRDVLAPGSGTPLSALSQVYGRGQGGAPQILGSALRTVLPNIGSEYTGVAPMALGAGTQNLLNLGAQRGFGAAGLSPLGLPGMTDE